LLPVDLTVLLGRDRNGKFVCLPNLFAKEFVVPMLDSALVTELRGFARELRQLAYTGHIDKEQALLDMSNRINERARAIEREVDHGIRILEERR
jgi:hypothetical protein